MRQPVASDSLSLAGNLAKGKQSIEVSKYRPERRSHSSSSTDGIVYFIDRSSVILISGSSYELSPEELSKARFLTSSRVLVLDPDN